MAKKLTSGQLARTLQIDPRTVRKWRAQGMPVAKLGRGGESSLFDLEAVLGWKGDRDEAARAQSSALKAARGRKELAQAIEAEQRVAIRARTLIPVDEVDRVWSSQVAALRARLLAMPTALADQLHRIASVEGATGIEAALETAVREALRELTSGSADAKRKKTNCEIRGVTHKRPPRMW